MKVQELIAELQKYDPDAEVTVPVQTYTQRYPSGYFSISWVKPSPSHNYRPDVKSSPRLYVHLPEGFVISERKS